MSSLARKYNRKERRALSRMTPEKARQVATESYDEHRAEIIAEVYGQFMTLILAWFHTERGYGKKRLKKFFWEFDDFVRAVRRHNRLEGMVELREILKDNAKFDIQEEYKKLIEEKGEYENNRT